MFSKDHLSISSRLAVVLVLLVSLINAMPAFANGSVIYVKEDASGANNGSTWQDAYTDLQSALATAISGDEIWVAAGTYKPTSIADRTISFVLKNGVALYGGFAGTETDFSQRNYETNVTILSGDIGFAGDTSDNSYHVVRAENIDNTAVLDGFTIQDGNANGLDAAADAQGGGVFNYTSNPNLSNLIVRDNAALDFGGGIYNDQSSPVLTNVTLIHNSAFFFGGGMYNLAQSSPSMVNVTLAGNTARAGGGMYSYDSSTPTLTDVIFRDNEARYGAGMYNGTGSHATLRRVTFRDNFAIYAGGTSQGGGMYNFNSNATLTDVLFLQNFAALGGGISNSQSSPVLNNVLFAENLANLGGAGIYNLAGSNALLTNVTFSGNTTNSGAGGGMLNDSSNPTLLNVTFSNNTAAIGGGVANVASSPTVTNTILWANGTEIYNDGSSSSTITHSIVQGGYAGTGNIDANPLLGPLQDNGGFTQTMALSGGSPAIDAGDDANCPAVDQRGIARPQGAHCDIGAYESIDAVTVTKIDDTNDGVCDSDCSLREAVDSAPDGGTVNFAPHLAGQTIALGSSVSIDKNLTIDGSSLSSNIKLDGNSTVQVLLGIQQDVFASMKDLDFLNAEYGIFAHGGLSVTNSSFVGNGTGIQAGTQLTVANSNFSENRAGIVNFWELQVDNSNFTNNGLGIYNEKVYAFSSLGRATITNCVFVQNNSGGIVNRDGILKVTDSRFTSNESDHGGAIQSNGIETRISNTLFENNHATGNGGAINGGYLMITDSIFLNNVADDRGGAIFGHGEITNSTFTANEAGNRGGGVFTAFQTTVSHSTFSNNFATTDGGAIYHHQESTMADPSRVTNNTFYGNSAGSMGGGIFNDSALSLLNNTFSNNNASNGGNLYNANGSYVYGTEYTLGDLYLYNNILANSSSGADCYNEANTIINAANNLIENNSGAPSNCGTPTITIDPQLGPLQDNGGPTQTMALGIGSPAINAGNDASCTLTDQRGIIRPQGAHCDIGAYEYEGPFGDTVPPVVESVTRVDANPTLAPQVNFLVMFSEDVTGVDASDFSLRVNGPSGAAISAVLGNGSSYTVSVQRGSGSGTIHLDVVDDDSIVDVASNPLGGAGLGTGDFDQGEFYTIPQLVTLSVNSVAANDGWVLESGENSNLGGSVNATAGTFNVGDDKANRQFVGLLHFDTSGLPDNAVIMSVTLKVRKQGLSGTDPFTTHGGLLLDIQKPYFGTTAGLLASDFESAAGGAAVSTFDPVPFNNWYSAVVDSTGFSFIDLTGTTQFRLRFTLDDDNDRSGDAILFYSGEAAAVKGSKVTNRPQLIIQYYIP